MTCKFCGNQLPDGAQFCGACGMKQNQQETPAQTVPIQQDAPAYQAASARRSAAPAPKKKGLPTKTIAIAVAAVVVVVAVIAIFGMLGGKTVYLQTNYVSESDTSVYENTYEYDEEGRLVSYEYSVKYRGDLDYLDPFKISWEYEYDEDGKIIAAECDTDDFSFELEYVYDKNGHLEAIESDDFEGEIECDEEGRITEVTVEGDIEITAEYSYHDNGMMEEMEYEDGNYKYNYVYDENGRTLESTTYYKGEKNTTYEYEYDEDGNMLSYTYCYYSTYDGSKTENTYSYTYDKKGELIGYVMEFSNEDYELTVECEVVTDGNVEEFVILEISGDEEGYTYITDELDEGDTYMEREYDDNGNLIRSAIFTEYETETEYEYMEFKAPRGYQKPDTDDPIYFQILD